MWQGIEGHDEVLETFRRRLASGRLASTYLFTGPRGIGKRSFAVKLAQALLCLRRADDTSLDPCGQCESCVLLEAGNHPDLLTVRKPEDKSEIPLALLIGPKENRMRQGLCYDIGLKPFLSKRRVAIMDDADLLNEEGANSLLKTLEEPPPGSVLILISPSAAAQLSTIRSRSQIVRFRPLPPEQLAGLLLAQGAVDDRETALQLAAESSGSVQRALELADPAVHKMRGWLWKELANPTIDSLGMARSITGLLDELGAKDAGARRNRLRMLVGFAADYFRAAMRAASGAPPTGQGDLQEAARRGLEQQGQTAELYALCLERCVEALGHIDRNANQATLLECWLNDLERAVASGSMPVAL